MAREESRGKRPFKVWDVWRSLRKSLVVNNLKELEFRGKEKLSIPASEPVRLVLESDGTQVEDGEYFRTLPNNTVILILRQGERWYPVGVDVIKTAISAIPKIVCETIHALELQDETPSWKIMDNKGRVTVVLHWDQRSSRGEGSAAPTSGTTTPKKQPSLIIQTGADPGPSSRSDYPPRITIINHDDHEAGPYAHSRLSKQGGSVESANIHVHTPECAHHAHQPTASRASSPVNGNGLDECDFHCCALHEEGRKIAVHKSVATSPIQDSLSTSPQQHPSSMSDPTKRGSSYSKGHVRFLDIEGCSSLTHQQLDHESSESETETTVMEDESLTSEKFLLLVDQLTVDVKKHLSIKDIGIILERLSSKIIDVERLDRESESDDVHNWTIKATIRGEVLRELGVIYNGNYYAISEHPGYREESEEARDENEEDEDDAGTNQRQSNF